MTTNYNRNSICIYIPRFPLKQNIINIRTDKNNNFVVTYHSNYLKNTY